MMIAWSCAAAQTPVFKPGAAEDLRALYATSADIAEGRRVAESSCARCHGMNGISTAKGTPHIAGQRAAYIHLQLRAYQKRPKGAMESAVRFLRDDALVAVAAYYASQEPARPAPGSAKPAADSDPLLVARQLSASCAGCHGESGVSSVPGMPSLVGLDPKYFVAAMNAYKSGERRHDMMKNFAAPLADTALQNLALYYALQKPARAQTPASGDAAAGKKAAAACGGCHGESGVSSIPGTPSLAGQDAQYLAEATLAYKTGARRDETMKAPAAALDERAVKDLAAFYAAQEPQAPEVRKPLTLGEWTQRDVGFALGRRRQGARRPLCAATGAARGVRADPRKTAMSEPPLHRSFRHFSELPLSLRVLYTATLLILGMGYLFALIYLFHTYSGKDGNPMGLSYEDIVIAYSGSGKASRLEAALQGSMSVMLPKDELAPIVAWVQEGAERAGFEKTIRPTLEKRCMTCHDGSNPHLANLNGFDNVKKVTERDTGTGIFTLVRVSHIHLFGLTFVFFLLGTIFSHAYVRPVWLKCSVIVLPFVALVLDVGSWYFTKIYHPFAWLVMLGGAFIGLSFAFMWLVSMYQLWFSRVPAAVAQRDLQ
jgi:cytochrome c553